jgi:hypothetical protein
MKLDRFPAPSKADNFARCVACQTIVMAEELDAKGCCMDCTEVELGEDYCRGCEEIKEIKELNLTGYCNACSTARNRKPNQTNKNQ